MSNSAFTPTFAQNLQDASATQKGLVNTTTQVFAGKKTFDGGAAIKGDTSGSAVAAGYVGETIPFTYTTVTISASNTWAANTTELCTLTAGIWLVYATMTFGTANAGSVAGGAVSTNSNNNNTNLISYSLISYTNNATAGSASQHPLSPRQTILVASPSTQKLYAKGFYEDISSGGIDISGFALRIA